MSIYRPIFEPRARDEPPRKKTKTSVLAPTFPEPWDENQDFFFGPNVPGHISKCNIP